jgi:endonuclease III
MASTPTIPDPTSEERRNARTIYNRIKKRYPVMKTALDYRDAWELLVSTVLSAQTTDENVNKVAPKLFAEWPTPEDLAHAPLEAVEQVVYSTGYYRQKSKSVVSLAADVVDKFGGEVPDSLDDLVTLRGVGRKTASVVLAEVWDRPAIAVDTHVKRVANRLGLTDYADPAKIEFHLKALLPKSEWSGVSMRIIQFGRDVCDAKKPRCWECPLADRCSYEAKASDPG